MVCGKRNDKNYITLSNANQNQESTLTKYTDKCISDFIIVSHTGEEGS